MTRPYPIARGASAREILVTQAELDFDRSMEHLRERFHHHKRGAAGAAARGLEVVIFAAIKGLGVRRRLRRDTEHLIDLALRVRAGEDPESVAREHVRDLLRLREMSFFVRVRDPAFQAVLAQAESLFAERLPDLARLAAVPDAGDYATLVTRAFPDPDAVDAIVTDNAQEILALIAHVEANPHVLRGVPDAWVPKATDIAREFITWKVADVREQLETFYGNGHPSA